MILMDFNNDGRTDVNITFPQYVTKMKFAEENFTFAPIDISGTLKDVSGLNKDNGNNPPGANLTVRIWRTDSIEDVMYIYCGAYNRTSKVVIPYKPATEGNGGSEDDGSINPVIQALVIAVVVLFVIYLLLRGSRKSSTVKYGKGKTNKDLKGRRSKKRP